MSNADWYAKKLGQPQRPSVPPSAPSQPTPYIHTPGNPNVPVSYDPNQDQIVTKAQSARQNDRCPGCNSGNYMAPMGTNLKRCYDCGYPLVQAGTGVTDTRSGAAIPAKQPAQGNGFNPDVAFKSENITERIR